MYPQTESELLEMKYDEACSSDDVIEIDVYEFKTKLSQGIPVIDVREIHELPNTDFETIRMPLSSFLENLDKIEKNKEYVIICQHGVRSLNTLYYLKEKEGFTKLTSLSGGIVEYYQVK